MTHQKGTAMSNFTIGDHVAWKRNEYTLTGVVSGFGSTHGYVYVKPVIAGIDGAWVSPDRLTRVTSSLLVAAIAARELPDDARENAIAGCRIADVVDDYAEAVEMGDMSGAEL